MIDLLPYTLLLYALAVTFVAGFVKGAVGFAMPLIMISGLSILIDLPLVAAGIVIPVMISNGMQVWRAGLGKAREALREHVLYIVLVCIFILIATQFVRRIEPNTLYIILGVPVLTLCLIQLAGWQPQIPHRSRRLFEWVAGIFSGILGGLAGTWGPPTVLYLIALRTPRAQQMSIQGVIYGLGSIMLFLGHLQSGVLNSTTWRFSALLALPALLGMWFGGRLGDRFDQERFRKVTLVVLAIAGANLIRRGIMG